MGGKPIKEEGERIIFLFFRCILIIGNPIRMATVNV